MAKPNVYMDNTDGEILKQVIKDRINVLRKTIKRLREDGAPPKAIKRRIRELQCLHLIEIEAYHLTHMRVT